MNRSTKKRAAQAIGYLGSVLGLGLVAACGGAEAASAPKSAAPAEESRSEPRSVQEAQDQIARAVADLNGSATGGADVRKKAADPSPGGAPAPPPPPAAEPKTAADAPTSNANSCVEPCRALASMRRAVDALCRMTGDTDNRCVDAKKTLTDSVTRTATCGCSS